MNYLVIAGAALVVAVVVRSVWAVLEVSRSQRLIRTRLKEYATRDKQ